MDESKATSSFTRREAIKIAGIALAAIATAPRAFADGKSPLDFPRATIIQHLGRPMLAVDGKPLAMTAYSPSFLTFHTATPRFFKHDLDVYYITIGRTGKDDFFRTAFWDGDRIESTPFLEERLSLKEQVETISAGAPHSRFIVRYFSHEPGSWRALHSDELVITEDGKRLEVPSLASELFWDAAARHAAAVIEFCERQPWADKIVGYANFGRVEGTHEPMLTGDLFDHSPVMQVAWQKYHGADEKAEVLPLPKDLLRGPTRGVSAIPYWQSADANQPLRDYLLLQRQLYLNGIKKIAAAQKGALDRLGRERVLVHDTMKQVMLGWHNTGFFDPGVPWPLAYQELMAGSGAVGLAELFDAPGFDGLITPHDYQFRGAGGVFEPEGAADSGILRGKLMFCEMDTRTFTGSNPNFPAKNQQEFAAITWRNIATSLTRGFTPYWMDVYEDWFATSQMHDVIQRQVDVLKQAATWPHQTMPGIAMIIDDWSVLETSGDGRFLNEAVMHEWKLGLARCGVPFRTYLLEDLELDQFPEHRIFYFPNLFRIDDKRLDLLQRKVFRKGNVVVWGPGSGISDGKTIDKKHATRLTGFDFDFVNASYPRRTLISDFDHPITRNLKPDTLIGGPLAYGPCLYPKDGTRLGVAMAKEGRDVSGLAVKEMGVAWDESFISAKIVSTWHSVFTSAVPIPADLWRGLARFAGTHVYCDDNEVVLANKSVVAIHSLRTAQVTLRLPGRFAVTDVTSGKSLGNDLSAIDVDLKGPDTRVFHLS